MSFAKKSWLAVGLALLLVFTAGCGSGASTGGSASGDQEANNEKTRVIQHAMGETKIKGTPERVVVLTNDGVDNALALGIKPVGAVKSWIGDPWYDFIKDDMKGVEVVGEEVQPNLEKIAALKPDLILGSKVRHEKIYDKLSAIAPTVYSETVGHVWKDNFKLYAKALNKEEKADQLLKEWDQKIADFQEKMGDKLDTKVSIIRFLPGLVRIHHNGFPDAIVKEAGLKRPKSQIKEEHSSEVTEERIPEMDGDVMFVLTMEEGDGKATKLKEEWMNKPLFKKLDVVKEGKVYEVNDVYWNLSGGIQGANKMLDDLEKHLAKK
ncbi:iron complex transport system substrate-binding protein [Melghirimyces profundicolus]|uniref:Iron complex transport system substrate-binding protein n=1 Tax=Melghirimyces profundicolus TaxID=1242148 RepID=A0A2T6BXF4_9BACL|nr:iron-siderophore ABC transporter substrate-binding protein [Melghirimyces profundicolus]PTX60759.1 iron complex transport system substrate-binding protein [Melghirimyces profundicolus]